MRAIKIGSHEISVVDAENTMKELQYSTGMKLRKLTLYDGAAMIYEKDAMSENKPYNSIASLIARAGIYGAALIAGDGIETLKDVPEKFLSLLDYPEFYFRDK